MLVNDRLIFLQMQKTGCTHIESLLFKLFPESKQVGKHYKIPSNYNLDNRHVIGSIRDPWSWYLSYWTYSCLAKGGPFKRTTQKRSLSNVFMNPRRANSHNEIPRSLSGLLNHCHSELTRPVHTWQYLYEDANDPQRFRQWLKLVLSNERKYDLFQDYGLSTVANFAGLYTYLAMFLYVKDITLLFSPNLTETQLTNAPLIVADFLTTERLNDDFIAVLDKLKVPITEDIHTALNGKTNSSKRKHARDVYYDQASIDLIAEKESYIIDKFGYQYG